MLIGWMFVISATAFLDRVNISVAGTAIKNEFNLTDLQLGPVFSAFVLGYALFQAPGGRIADRFGPRKVIAVATLWWGVFTALTGLIPATMAGSLVALLAVRFALGLGESVVYPASNRLVASWIPSRERGRANGLIFSGVGAGAGISPPLIAYIMVQYGWRASFLFSAVIGLAVGAVWLWICRDRPDQHPWVSPQEKDYIQAGLPAKIEGRPPLRWSVILANRNVLWITASYATFGYAAYIFFTWFFNIYRNHSVIRGINIGQKIKLRAFIGHIIEILFIIAIDLDKRAVLYRKILKIKLSATGRFCSANDEVFLIFGDIAADVPVWLLRPAIDQYITGLGCI